MSPEQAQGLPVGRRTDIWSVGIILWELFAGRPMFEGAPATIMLAIVRGEVPSLADVAPDTGSAIKLVVARALAPSVARRFPTAKVFARELEAACGACDLVIGSREDVADWVRRARETSSV